MRELSIGSSSDNADERDMGMQRFLSIHVDSAQKSNIMSWAETVECVKRRAFLH